MAKKRRGVGIIPIEAHLNTQPADKALDNLISKASNIKIDLRVVGQAEGRLKRVIKSVQADVDNIKLNPKNLEDFQTIITGIKNSTGDIQEALRNTAEKFIDKFGEISVSINGDAKISGLESIVDNLETIKQSSNIKFSISGVSQVEETTKKIIESQEAQTAAAKQGEKAIKQQTKETEKLAAAAKTSAQTTQGSTAAHEKNAAAIQQEKKATEQLSAAQEKVNKVQLKRVKTDSVDRDGRPIRYIPQTYTALNGRYTIEKGIQGWNVYDEQRISNDAVATFQTLKECRENLLEFAEQESSQIIAATQKQEQLTATGRETTQARQQEADVLKNIVQLVDNYGAKLDETNNKLMQGAKLLNEQAQVLRLFHNSPNIFDVFDPTKAGSNQGQALGFGYYLALKQNGEFNDADYGRYQTQWYANVQNPFKVGDSISSAQAQSIIDKFLADRAENFKQHMLSKLLDGDVVNAVKDIADESKTVVGDIFSSIGYDAIMDGAQINVFDPSKIYRANGSVLDISTKEFAALEELQKKIWEEQSIIEKAKSQIKELSNQYIGKTEDELDLSLFTEVLSKGYGWRQNVAKIASAFKELTGRLPQSDDISEESMQAIVENYEFSKQNLQEYREAVTQHQIVLAELQSQFESQKAITDAIVKSYLKGNIKGIVNKDTTATKTGTQAVQTSAEVHREEARAVEDDDEAQRKLAETRRKSAEAAEDATEQTEEQSKAEEDVAAAASNTNAEIKKQNLSLQERQHLFDGIDLNFLLKENYHIDDQNIEQVIAQFVKLGAAIKSSGQDSEALSDEFDNLVNIIMKFGSVWKELPTDDIDLYQKFLKQYKDIKIRPSLDNIVEFGDEETWKQVRKAHRGMFTDNLSVMTIDEWWNSLSDPENGFSSLFPADINAGEQLKWFISVFDKAKEVVKSKGRELVLLTQDQLGDVIDEMAVILSQMANNIDKISNGNSLTQGTDGTRKQLEGQNNSNDDDVLESLINKDVNRQLSVLKDALKNKFEDTHNLLDLSDLISTDQLKSKLHKMAQDVLNGIQGPLEFANVDITEGVAELTLFNKELGVTVTETWQLKDSFDSARESLTMNRLAAEKYAKQQEKQIDDTNKWLIGQSSKLNTQERSYKYSQKKIDGSTPLLNADATTLAKDADKTIDSLASHIQKRIQNAIGTAISESTKNEILQDLSALENEIKIQQLQKYTSTTMSASEIESARKSIVNMLDTIASKAKKDNVFDQISESYAKLRKRLTDNTVEDYIKNNFTDAINEVRVLKSDLGKAIAEQRETKKSQQALQNLLSLQERLYEAKKKHAELEAKGELNTSAGQKASRKVEELQQQYDAATNLLETEQQINTVLERESKLEQELNTLKAERAKQAVDAAWKNEFQNNYKYNNGKTIQDQNVLDQMSDFYKKQEESAKQFNNNIKSIYDELISKMKQINNLTTKINDLSFKDAGTGNYSKSIQSLQDQKSSLYSDLRNISSQISSSLNIKEGENGIAKFFEVAREKAILTSEEVQKFDDLLLEADRIGFNFADKLSDQMQPLTDKLASLKKMISDGIINKDSNIAKNILKIDSNLESKNLNFKDNKGTTSAMEFMKAANDAFEYINALDKVIKKEQQYFAGKQKYTVDTSMQSMAEDAKKAAEEVGAVQQKLTTSAQEFAKESGASGAIVTNFVQGADGIARLDFSVLDSGTNSLRKFRMEMGSVSEGTYITETTVNNFVSKAQAAAKQLESISSLIDRLKASGANMDQGSVERLVQLQKDLNAELTKGDAANETVITRLAKDAKISQAEVEKLYKKHIQLQEAINRGDAEDLGEIGLNGDVYKKLIDSINAYAQKAGGADVKIGKLNERTGQLKFTMRMADNTVREFTIDLDKLSKSAVVQETSVKDLGTKWEQFKNGLSKTGKQLITAFAGANVFYKVISEVRKGIGYVKEIDLAMTELKKVTDETDATYKQFLETASGTASVIGSTISDFTEATSNFARLGYSIQESAKMAETAIIYRNVADGLDTVEEATDSIISTMKAFGIEANDTMGIIDRFNAVGNNFAITSAGIGEALQRSASALNEAGNTIDESVALVTAANSVIQNPEQVGEMLADYKVA